MEPNGAPDDVVARGEIEVERGGALRRAAVLVLCANLVLMAASVRLLVGTLPGIPRPSILTMAISVCVPWIAVGAVWCFPCRFLFFPVPGDRRFSLFGVLFFASLAPFGLYCYAAPVRKLPVIELACVVGAALFFALLISELRAKGNPVLLMVAFPLSFGYGYAAVVQLNCVLDHSPAAVYTTVAFNKSLRRPSLDLRPWGPDPPAKSIMTPYHALVPQRVFDAIQEGSPVCVVQRQGALGIRWYTAQTCPWRGVPVTLGVAGSL